MSSSDRPVQSLGGGLGAGARRAARGRWVEWLARLGLLARGAVYLVIGGLAVDVALRHGRGETDQNGALRTIAAQPFGKLLLVVLAVGFAGYALWRFLAAAYGEGGDDGVGSRLVSLVRGLAYAAVCLTTVSLVTGAGNGKGGSAAQNQTLTARVMHHSGGRLLVGVVGLVLVGIGVALLVQGVRKKFLEGLELGRLSGRSRRIVERLGAYGTCARGVIFGAAGVFVVVAAVTYDARKARGLDFALKSLAGQPFGTVLLLLVALGLIAFGLFGLVEARYRRTSVAR